MLRFVRSTHSGIQLLTRSFGKMSEKEINQKIVCEIERKFKVPFDYHQRLEGFGFQQTKIHESLVDVYFDLSKSKDHVGN